MAKRGLLPCYKKTGKIINSNGVTLRISLNGPGWGKDEDLLITYQQASIFS